MIKLNTGKYIIGFDDGYQLSKSANQIFENGVHSLGPVEPTLIENSLFYEGNYYKIGEGRAIITDNKTDSENARLLTMVAIAKELSAEGLSHANVILAVGILVATILVIITFTQIIVPYYNYNKAKMLWNNGKYCESYFLLKSLNGYKDSVEIVNSIKEERPFLGDVGETVYLGNTEWIVLAREGNKSLLISKYVVVQKNFDEYVLYTTWEECTLRYWLNETYYNTTFSSDEQSRILENSSFADCIDKVFLLSLGEANSYFSSSADRQATKSDGTSVVWWLRSCGKEGKGPSSVKSDGTVYQFDHSCQSDYIYVRPALWVDISDY